MMLSVSAWDNNFPVVMYRVLTIRHPSSSEEFRQPHFSEKHAWRMVGYAQWTVRAGYLALNP